MSMLFSKKMLAFYALVLVLILSDMMVVYGVSNKMKCALENAVDGALVFIMDQEALGYSNIELYASKAKSAFTDVLRKELELNKDLSNSTFFKHGVSIDNIEVAWKNSRPYIRAGISTDIDTTLLGKIVSKYNTIEIRNRVQMMWQWAQ